VESLSPRCSATVATVVLNPNIGSLGLKKGEQQMLSAEKNKKG
jgi:hypothetical protein